MSEALVVASAATSTVGVLTFGFLLGLKHATEADHVVAISTVVSQGKGLLKSAIVGGFWGLGHTVSLFLAGIFVLLLDFQINAQTERSLEMFVGIMLTLLGLNVLRKLAQGGQLHLHAHDHGTHMHVHPHIHENAQIDRPDSHHGFSFSPRSFLIGMVHGVAGSAALMLLIIPTIGSRTVGLLYVLIFGVGSIAGMALMTLLVGLPFHLTAMRFARFNHVLQGTAGLAGIILGLWIVYENGFA
jgi:high-affinity nickel permease